MRRRMTDGQGYIKIDHSHSPGLTDEEMVAIGLPVIPSLRKGQVFEAGMIRCAHCPIMVILNPKRVRPRNYCPKCHEYVCEQPGCINNCTPFDEQIEDLFDEANRSLNV